MYDGRENHEDKVCTNVDTSLSKAIRMWNGNVSRCAFVTLSLSQATFPKSFENVYGKVKSECKGTGSPTVSNNHIVLSIISERI